MNIWYTYVLFLYAKIIFCNLIIIRLIRLNVLYNMKITNVTI